MSVDFNNINSVIEALDKVLKLKPIGGNSSIPAPIIILGVPRRSGISPTKVASKIIARQSEAGIPVGALPSGAINPNEIMIRIMVEEIVKSLQEDAIIEVGIPAGTTLTASGASPAGPVSVVGSTISITKGYGVIK